MTQEIKRKITRQRLIDKGYELMNTHGYQAISIDKVIGEVNLTKGAFYYHFENKHQFVEAIIQERISKEIHSEFIEPINKHGNPKFILVDLFENKLVNNKNLNQSAGSSLSNFIIALSHEENDHELQEQLKEIYQEWKVALINLLYRGIEGGFFNRHFNTESVAEFIISSLEGTRTLRRIVSDDSLFYNYIEQFKNYVDTLKAENKTKQLTSYSLAG